MSSPVLALTVLGTIRSFAAAAASSRRARPQARRAAPQRRRRVRLTMLLFRGRREGTPVEALAHERGLAELRRGRVAPQDGVGGAVGVPMRRRLGRARVHHRARVHRAHRCGSRPRLPSLGYPVLITTRTREQQSLASTVHRTNSARLYVTGTADGTQRVRRRAIEPS